MQNYLKKLSANILISTAIYSITTLSSYAAQDLFETDDDIQVAIDSGFKQVISKKSTELAQRYKLSDKGDLTPVEHRNGEPKRREFYMLGDGNCALWSMGTDHPTAQALILNNSNNAEVRRIAHQEIVDEFDNLPEEMRDAEYNNLRNSLADANLMLSWGIATVGHPEYNAAFRNDVLREEANIRQRIRQWAQREQVYRDYATHVLINGHYMLYRQDIGTYATYFIDALAHLMNKNLLIWTQSHNQTMDLLSAHPGNDNHPLLIAHQYAKNGAAGTLEIIHRGNHFNRLVRINDNAGLLQASQDEATALHRLAAYLERRSTNTIIKDELYLNFQVYEAILNDDCFSAEEKEEVRRDYEALKKEGIQQHKINPQVIKAYCLASIEVFEKHREKLTLDAQLDPEALERAALAILENIPDHFRANNSYMQQKRMQSALGVRNARAAQQKKQKAQEELPRIERKIALFEKMSNRIKLNVTDTQIFEVLNKIILRLGLHNEELLALKEEKEELGEEIEALEAKYQKSVALKNLYEGVYRNYQEEFLKNLPRRLKFGVKAAQGKVNNYLAKDPTIHNIRLKTDFNNAKLKLEEIAVQEQQAGRPYLNPLTLMYDPFLTCHNRDINSEYPADISWDEFMDILESTKEAILKILIAPEDREDNYKTKNYGDIFRLKIDLKDFNLLNEGHILFHRKTKIDNPLGIPRQTWIDAFNCLRSVFNRTEIYENNSKAEMESKNTLRKRIKRLLDSLLKNAQAEVEDGDDPAELALDAWAKFGALMAQNDGRCIDGVSNGVESFETQIVYGEGGTPLLEQKISKLIINDRHAFILQHKLFGQGIEEETGVPEMTLQRLRHVMSLRGNTRELNYPGFGKATSADLAPAKIMERYLKGDQAHPEFQARTPDYIAELLYQAHVRSNNKVKGKGETISLEEINGFTANDPYMGPLYLSIVDRVVDGEVGVFNDYFEDHKGVVHAKKAFFMYTLKRLGYVIDPHNPKLNLLGRNEPVEKDAVKLKLSNAFYYHKGNNVPSYSKFDSHTERKILQLAYQYVIDGSAPPDTSALSLALEKFSGYERFGEIGTVLNYFVSKQYQLFTGLTPEEKEKITIYSGEFISKNKTLQVSSAVTKAAYRVLGERHFNTLQNIFNYHKDKGAVKFQGFNKIDERRILQIAGTFVVKEKTSPDTIGLNMAIERFWSKQYKAKLSAMLQNKKQQTPFRNLETSEEKTVLKDALKLVEEGTFTFEEALLKTAQSVSANHYKDSLSHVLSYVKRTYPNSDLGRLNERDSQSLINHASLLVAQGRAKAADTSALNMALQEINK